MASPRRPPSYLRCAACCRPPGSQRRTHHGVTVGAGSQGSPDRHDTQSSRATRWPFRTRPIPTDNDAVRAGIASVACFGLAFLLLGVLGADDWSDGLTTLWYALWIAALILAVVAIFGRLGALLRFGVDWLAQLWVP